MSPAVRGVALPAIRSDRRSCDRIGEVNGAHLRATL